MLLVLLRSPARLLLTLCCTALIAASCGPPVTRPADESQRQAQDMRALVVPIEGTIDSSTVAFVTRALRQAQSMGTSHVVLRLNSPGGLVDAMRETESLLDSVQSAGVHTVALIQGRAISAAAYLALVCNQLYMMPGSEIGAITQVEMSPVGIQQIENDDARRKVYASYRKDVRSRLEQRGLTGDALRVGEAMVDPSMAMFQVTYRDNSGFEVTKVVDRDELATLQSRGADIITQIAFSRPVVLTHLEAEDVGISEGTLDTLEQLVTEHLLLSMDQVGVLERSWSENTVAWLDGIKWFLFLAGFILLLIELKTPGFAVPGVLGVLLLGFALFNSYLVGLAEWTEIILFFLGLAALAVEIFVLPGMIVFGVVGFLCLVAAMILSQQSFVFPTTGTQQSILFDSLLNLTLVSIGTLFGAWIAWKFLPNVPVFNRVFLRPPDRSLTGDSTRFHAPERGEKLRQLVGREGVAATTLRPAGILELAGERIDVVTKGDFVEAGTPIRVIGVDANRVVVEAIDEPPDSPASGSESGSVGIVVLLLVIGLVLVVAEVIFVSFGVISLLSAASLVTAVFMAFQEGQGFGFLVLAIEAMAIPIAIYLALKQLPHTRIGQMIMLRAPDSADVSKAGEEKGLGDYLAKTGVTLCPLRPAGYARIDGRRVDVVTRGEMLDEDCPVVVVEVIGNRVVVARADEEPSPTETESSTESS